MNQTTFTIPGLGLGPGLSPIGSARRALGAGRPARGPAAAEATGAAMGAMGFEVQLQAHLTAQSVAAGPANEIAAGTGAAGSDGLQAGTAADEAAGAGAGAGAAGQADELPAVQGDQLADGDDATALVGDSAPPTVEAPDSGLETEHASLSQPGSMQGQEAGQRGSMPNGVAAGRNGLVAAAKAAAEAALRNETAATRTPAWTRGALARELAELMGHAKAVRAEEGNGAGEPIEDNALADVTEPVIPAVSDELPGEHGAAGEQAEALAGAEGKRSTLIGASTGLQSAGKGQGRVQRETATRPTLDAEAARSRNVRGPKTEATRAAAGATGGKPGVPEEPDSGVAAGGAAPGVGSTAQPDGGLRGAITMQTPQGGRQDQLLSSDGTHLGPHDMTAFAEADTDEVVAQVMSRMRVLESAAGERSLEVHLRPEHLGRILLRVSGLPGGAVHAALRADRPEVAGLLRERIAELTQALSEQGLRVGGVDVTTLTQAGAQHGSAAGTGGRQGWSDGRQAGAARQDRSAERVGRAAANAALHQHNWAGLLRPEYGPGRVNVLA